MALNKFAERKLEWSLAVISFLYGIWLSMPFPSLSSSGYDDLTALVPETAWGIFFIISGAVNSVALHINGRAWWTPFVRLFVAFMGGQVFLLMSLSIFSFNWTTSAGFLIFLIGVIQYGLCILEAAKDCGRELKIREAQNGAH